MFLQVNQMNQKIDKVLIEAGTEKQLTPKFIFECCQSNQDGDAALFKILNGNKFCYDHAGQRWYRWKGHFWAEDDICEHLAAIEGVIELYAKEAESAYISEIEARKSRNKELANIYKNKAQTLNSRISQLRTLSRKKQILELSTYGDEGLGIKGNEWDQQPSLLACPNGVIDLKTGQLTPGDQNQYIKTACPTEYDKNAPQPKAFLRFLDEIFDGNKNLVRYILRLLGYALIGEVIEHILPIFYGQGRNGKGTFLQIISHVLGPLAGPVEPELLLDQGRTRSSAGPSPDIVYMRGKRILFANETNEGHRLNSSKVKMLVGGDERIGRDLYAKKPVIYRPTDTLFLTTNHKPRIPNDDYALWNRIHLIPFALSFVNDPQEKFERKADKRLVEKLYAESESILKLLVDESQRYQREGLNPPIEVIEATAEYRDDEDILGGFISECLVLDPEKEILASELYHIYKMWCERSGHRPLSQTAFGRRMGTRFKKSNNSRNVKYFGIRILE